METRKFPSGTPSQNRYTGDVTKKFAKLPCYLVVDGNNRQSYIWTKKSLSQIAEDGKYKVVKKVKYKPQFPGKK